MRAFDRALRAACKERYRVGLATFIARRGLALVCVAILIVLFARDCCWSSARISFPLVDAGHDAAARARCRPAPASSTPNTWSINIERAIRTIIPADELEGISDNIGLPISYDLAFYQTDSIGPQDADMLIQLKPKHQPTAMYQQQIRDALATQYPQVTAYFQAADIVSQVLNFGLPAAIDAQINGNNLAGRLRHRAAPARSGWRAFPASVDLRIAEPLDYPSLQVNVDRAKALAARHHAAAGRLEPALLALRRAAFAAELLARSDNRRQLQRRRAGAAASVRLGRDAVRTFRSARPHRRAAQPPAATPATATHAQPQLLGNVATISHGWDPAVVAHYTVQRVIDVDCAVSGRDLGSVTNAVQQRDRQPRQAARRHPGRDPRPEPGDAATSFATLGEGLMLAIILVYLLMVANFQSWLEPFIIMMAVPGALAGVLWMLVLTGTTINVESLMGAIMAVGVGVANGNLLITFANELREEGYGPVAAAIEAGRIRFRPIIMTALAMILGMLPMALALGSGSEQNAPLGRAVIGGLLAGDADDAVRGAGGLFDLQPQPDRQTSARRGDRGNSRCPARER